MTPSLAEQLISPSIWDLLERPACVVVDLDAIEINLRSIIDHCSPSTQVMAVVKADGYGHGAEAVARTAIDAGAGMLGVATLPEALHLRPLFPETPILILSPIMPANAPVAAKHGISIALGSMQGIQETIKVVTRHNGDLSLRIHLKIDTGMRRFGVAPGEVVRAAVEIRSSQHLVLEGAFTQFASADTLTETTLEEQWGVFRSCLDSLTDAGIDPGIRHAANSAAILRSRRFDLDMVRLGISLYGLSPSEAVQVLPSMRPALSLMARIQRVFPARRGDRVSYGGTFELDEDQWLGLVPVGYADGYPRLLSNQGWAASHGGDRLPVLGRVCMDQFVIGLGSASRPVVAEQSPVTLIATDAGGAPTMTEFARMAQTIPYETSTSLALRLPRVYLRQGKVVAVDTGSQTNWLS